MVANLPGMQSIVHVIPLPPTASQVSRSLLKQTDDVKAPFQSCHYNPMLVHRIYSQELW